MSETKLVSPLLDGFAVGDSISEHDGVRCCPAMRENSDEKYIVKIVSVPASQKQLDALLLTGAYSDPAAATEYFRELSDEVVKEAMLLQQLGKLEGFLPYEGWQIAPMEGSNLGYDVYLIGPYRKSLQKYLSRNTITHLGAVNLGLDVCSALSICRRTGHMYVDLKPENIFLINEKEYRIGDLGFVKMNALKFTSLPTKYRSCYTPPEMHDAMSTLNPTADTYALGMILYQIYNNNLLPFQGKAPNKPLPAPLNADYEMAEIILKAITPNPRNRYQTPIEMGKALVSYMQRNTVNDDPLVPPAAEPLSEKPIAQEILPVSEESSSVHEEAAENAPDEFAFLNSQVADETLPEEEDAQDMEDTALTEELSTMLAQAEDLLSAEESSVQPEFQVVPEEPFPVPAESDTVEPPSLEAAEQEEDLDLAALLGEETAELLNDELDIEDDDSDDGEDAGKEEPNITGKKKKSRKGLTVFLIILILLALLAGGAYYYYTNYYLLPIDKMSISVHEDSLTVDLETDADLSLLTVFCTDTYGNTLSQKPTGKQVVFTGLSADTTYKITVEAEGFHQATQSCSGSASTAKQTSIAEFTAKTGNEDGSAILSFTVAGPDTQDWSVEYSAEGEETKTATFSGHTVTVTGLTVNKTYTFKLMPSGNSDGWIVGNNTLEFTASKIVYAEDLRINSCRDGVLTADWHSPMGTTVSSWTVRCYSEAGYDQTVTVTEPKVSFEGIDASSPHTIEVWAKEMTQSVRTYLTANPTNITEVTVDDSTGEKLTISWSFEGAAPTTGWHLMYKMDPEETYQVIPCESTTGEIELYVPGAAYYITIQAADGTTVFGGDSQHRTDAAPAFENYSLKAEDIQLNMCRTPKKTDWTYRDINSEDYTTNFSSGDKISVDIYGTKSFYYRDYETKIMFVIRDGDGNVQTNLVKTKDTYWKSMWKNRHCALDIPAVPSEAGNYILEIYFDGTLACSSEFKITMG